MTILLTEDQFNDQYAPSTILSYNEIVNISADRIWTVVDGEDDNGLYASPGAHTGIGYITTEKPWEHENIEATYMEPVEACPNCSVLRDSPNEVWPCWSCGYDGESELD
jgi:hypothetical protein